ncbi:hypothetical protein ACJJTC_011308 [Scirpophaga incertulas]
MTSASVVLACVIAIYVSELSAWTIDLPEVRRYYFEKFSNSDNGKPELSSNQYFYDNINGDSLHNTDRKHNENVADYIKKQTIHSLPIFTTEAGNKENVYANAYKHGIYMLKKDVPGNTTLPISVGNLSSLSDVREMCRKATDASEHVRRLADLVLHATKRLQDVAYTAKYSKDASMEENELLLRLAWYLDKLAQLTGFEPNPEDFMIDELEPTNPPPDIPLPNPLNLTDEVKNTILNCLKEKSDVPATVRCALPNTPPLVDQIRALLGGAPLPSTFLSPDTARVSRSSADNFDPALEPEIMEAQDNKGILERSAAKSLKKRSTSDEQDPLVKLLKYYTKYKVWEFANPKRERDEPDDAKDYYVENHLRVRTVSKRSVPVTHVVHDFPIPEIHKHPLHEHIQPAIHHLKEKIDFDKLFAKKVTALSKIKAIAHILRHKRSLHENYALMKPRVPVNPQGDISYYVKNKEGTNIRADLVQAALLRAALEAVYQRGNINVVHRYGANYNPAVPAPFYFGVARSVADI